MLTADDFRASKLRGFMFGSADPDSRPSPSFFSDAQACGANIGRTWVNLSRSGDSYIIPPGTLETIDFYLENIQFPTVLAVTAGDINPGQDFWMKASLQSSLVSIWTQIALRYKNSQLVAGYDLLNEPVYAAPVTTLSWSVWNPIAQRLYNAIRRVDPNHVVIVCPSPGGIPTAYYYYNSFLPIVGINIVYSLHFYEPYNVTHWGVYPSFPMLDTLYYPGDKPSTSWPPGKRDENWLATLLHYPRAWSLKYNIPIFVSEFSCVRWALNRSRELWLRDSINLFNQYGFSWAYLAWRSWQGWDPENKSLSTVVNDDIHDAYGSTITILRKAFSAQYIGKDL